jgi:spore coat polysaccharide biosynthesis predicted glycosyltransferase SpsG
MNILCYCESNHKTGFGHFSRIKILITLIKKKYPKAKLLIFSKNKKEAKEFFKTK